MTEAKANWKIRLQELFDRLNERERRLLIIAVWSCLGLVVVGSFWIALSTISSRQKQVELVRTQLKEISALQYDYQDAKRLIEKSEKQFKSNTVSLFSLIQTVATQRGLSLSDLNEQKTPIAGTNLVESSVDVNVKKISIDKLTSLVEATEDSQPLGLIKVTGLEVKTRYDDPTLLDAQVEVSTWKSATN